MRVKRFEGRERDLQTYFLQHMTPMAILGPGAVEGMEAEIELANWEDARRGKSIRPYP